MKDVNIYMDRCKVQQCFQELDYDFTDFNIDHFMMYVQHLRQRKIISQPYPFSAGISGLWLETRSVDFIFFQSRTHPIHQTHIRLHEVAHMLLDHPRKPITQLLPPEMLKELAQSDNRWCEMKGQLRSRVINRRSDVYEEEAEYFVELIQGQVVKADRLQELTRPGTSIRTLEPYIKGLPYAPSNQSDLE